MMLAPRMEPLGGLATFDPFQDLMTLQQRINRLFDEVFPRSEWPELTRAAWAPAVDIAEDAE
ncbi:MAG: hypothetical protein HY314_12455 [Acidobacteria bacterium]|nr:hypothetical protein [Acidobacteriota bacterium]